MHLEDLLVLGSMGPPGGGRTFISNRLIRHFNIVCYTDSSNETIVQIFGTLVQYFLGRFSEDVQKFSTKIAEVQVFLYQIVRAELLPTPTKSHYTFNMRDISKVFQGVCGANPKVQTTIFDIFKLWFHENLRIFYDRLVNVEDRNYLVQLMIQYASKFELQEDLNLFESKRTLFCDFL